jgi:hypothetical protein
MTQTADPDYERRVVAAMEASRAAKSAPNRRIPLYESAFHLDEMPQGAKPIYDIEKEDGATLGPNKPILWVKGEGVREAFRFDNFVHELPFIGKPVGSDREDGGVLTRGTYIAREPDGYLIAPCEFQHDAATTAEAVEGTLRAADRAVIELLRYAVTKGGGKEVAVDRKDFCPSVLYDAQVEVEYHWMPIGPLVIHPSDLPLLASVSPKDELGLALTYGPNLRSGKIAKWWNLDVVGCDGLERGEFFFLPNLERATTAALRRDVTVLPCMGKEWYVAFVEVGLGLFRPTEVRRVKVNWL